MTARIRRHLTMGGAAAATACLAASGVLTTASSAKLPPATGAAPARLLVYVQEWSLWPSRPSVKAGKLVVQLWNRGQDAHDLRIRRLRRGAMVGGTQGDAVTQSGRVTQATWHLAPGTYELYCSMPGHLRRGMHARITVR